MSHICANCGASLIESQALCTACGELANRPDKTQLRPRVSLPDIVDFWWLGIPRKLRRYSQLLWAAWSDGIYLTSFPRMAVVFPIVLLLFGFFEGATHWSPVTIDSNALNTTIPAVTFAQILHLLFIAALLGSMSADFGLMIVVGFALGDYLVAGPFFRFGPWAPVSGFFSYRVPQIFTYWIFLSLAVAPTVAANGLLAPVRRWLPRDNTPSVLGRVAASALVQGLLVYLWIPLATVTVRVVWAWVQQTPPLDVSDYIRMLNPWLPLAAGIGVILRAVLVRLTRGDQQLDQRTKRLQQDAAEADLDLAWTRRMPLWLRAVFSGAASTVLLSGLISNQWSALVVGGGLVGICLLRTSFLPRLAWWMQWIDTIERIPLIFRLASTTVITYYLTLGLLQLPGSSPGLNPKAGQFQAELGCLGAGLLIMIVLMPFVPAASSQGSGPKRGLALSPAAASVVRNASLFLVVGLLLFVGSPAYAICLDPVCCFGSPANAALAVACLLLVLALFAIGGAAIAGLVALGEGLGEAAAMGEGAAALADTALADTAVADTALGGSISPLAQTMSGLADTAVLNTVSPLAQTVAAPISVLADTAAIGDTALASAIDPLAQTAAGPAFGLANTIPAAGGLGGAGAATGSAAVDVGTAVGVAGGATAVGTAASSGSGSLSGSSGSASDASATSGPQIGSGESGSTGPTSSGPTTGTTAPPSASQPGTSGVGVMGGTSSAPGSSSSGIGTTVIGSGSPAGSVSSGPASSSNLGTVGSGSSSGTGTAAPSGSAPSGPVSNSASTSIGAPSSPSGSGTGAPSGSSSGGTASSTSGSSSVDVPSTGTGTAAPGSSVPSGPVSNSASSNVGAGAGPSGSSTGTPGQQSTAPPPSQSNAASSGSGASGQSNSPAVAYPAENLPANP